MQQQWNDIDHYIESKLIPEDANLKFALNNTSAQGFPDHLAVAPNQGMLLQMLIQMNKCKRVLELGTFAAYSTLWLARVLPEDGYLMTIEGRDNHAALAQQNIDQANLAVPIELKVGRAAEILAAIDASTFEPFDFIFIDADKQSYPEYLELSLNLSHSGTVIVLDNVIRAGSLIDAENQRPSIEGIRSTFELMQNHPRLLSSTALQTVGSKGHDGFAIAIVK
ncbi:methyltransferase [Acinetobacter sp. C15]|uniref:O-methyltransferase n=1 Tax=Acinetobacter TaxID=469 RepID=UPI00066061F5|nr:MULTISPECIES: O-methyltransferase [Acinetobacter]KOR16429.1 methyltransferase [Acinetobacter sp. C15]MBO3640582.1 O-methyltransferase [Acinetobacter soli]WEH89720.1 O-methyltransferase [Acinetobacter soli]WEI10674.1 O-methyltransferase [Acinetobacter soli]